MLRNKYLTKAALLLRAAVESISKKVPAKQKWLCLLLLSLLLLKGLISLTLPVERLLARPSSLVVTDKEGLPLRGSLSSDDEWRLPVPLSEMGKWLPLLAVEIEDRHFYSHSGTDYPAIVRAFCQNISAGKVISGASTITSQTVRLAVSRSRTPFSKLLEFVQAEALETRLSKSKLLELYLNSVPFGGNTRGVEAAARTWFAKPAKELSLSEAVLLMVLLRGPSYYRPDRYPERTRELRDRLLSLLRKRGLVTAEEARRAKLEPLPKERRPIASAELQAAERAALLGEAKEHLDSFGRFRSTLDAAKQRLLRAELRKSLERLEPGITAAAVLVENSSGKVRGYIGNAKEGTGAEASWVDCAASPRSPGSALKPFIYALALQKGLLTPDTLLADVPTAAGGGTRNYDRLFRGPVSARSALCDSLNVPAVKVLRLAGLENTLALLRGLGFASLTERPEWYGESLALGGCEVTPLELARAYRALASGGRASSLLWYEKAETEVGPPLITPGAAALTLEMLKETRRSLPRFGDSDSDGKIIAFKTGTSYGLRDAWTCAVTPRWTLVVWFGDPTGRPHRSLTGLTAAAPAAVSIMLRLTPKGAKWFDLPAAVASREICPLSGSPRNPFCPEAKQGLYLKNVSDTTPCTLHIQYNGETSVKWPEEIARFYAERGRGGKSSLAITTPTEGAVYYGLNQKLLLTAQGGEGTLYWFVDGELLGASEGGGTLSWTMKPGPHTISAADEYGATDEKKVTVKSSPAAEREKLPLLEEY